MIEEIKRISKARNVFKTFTLLILVLMLFFQFLAFRYHFTTKIVPDGVSFFIIFICVFYLWITERIDREKLSRMYLELILAQTTLKEAQIDIIMSLGLSQEAKDYYTQGHSKRVTKYAVDIARELGLDKEEIDVIQRAGKLHDIGKIGISDGILLSKEKLTDEEYIIIKSHPLKSASILDPLKFLDREKQIIRHHHERFDGAGYPDGLAGEKIPLGARIIALADSFDAMKSERPYKEPFTKEDIIAEVKKNSGAQFDPKVVEAFLKIIDRFFV
ncbi:HD-GYP domain-containing protein [Candidatus Omnitrophota bacterium]